MVECGLLIIATLNTTRNDDFFFTAVHDLACNGIILQNSSEHTITHIHESAIIIM